jgi:drug/metabolite transporter (DMT)-like permease
MPVLRWWRPLIAYTLAEIIVPQFCLSTAEQRLPSSTTGLLIAAVPLAGVGVAFLLGRPERLAPRNWLGIALGMAGVAALVGVGVAGSAPSAVAEVLVVVAGYSLGPAILAKWMPGLPGTGVTALALVISAVAYAPVVAATNAWPSSWPSPSVLVSVAALALVCTAAAFIILITLIAEVGPVRATTVTYVNPAVALVAGAVVLGERVTGWSIAGFVLVLAGCFLVTFQRSPALPGGDDRPAAPEPQPPAAAPQPGATAVLTSPGKASPG